MQQEKRVRDIDSQPISLQGFHIKVQKDNIPVHITRLEVHGYYKTITKINGNTIVQDKGKLKLEAIVS